MAALWKKLGLNDSLCWLAMLVVLLATGCDESKFNETALAGGGVMNANGGPPFPLSFPFVTFASGATTTTVTLAGSYVDGNGLQQFVTINLVVPNGVTFSPIALSGSGTSLQEQDSNGPTFISTLVSGTAVMEEISANGISGEMDATFTDANADTRETTNVTFVINSFDAKP